MRLSGPAASAVISRSALQRAFTQALGALAPLAGPALARSIASSVRVAIPSTVRRHDARKAFVSYGVTVSLGRLRWRRPHRFSSFAELDSLVRAEVQRLPGAPLQGLPKPPRQLRISSSTMPGVVEGRRAELEEYVRALVLCPAAWVGGALLAFLDSPAEHVRAALSVARIWSAAEPGTRKRDGAGGSAVAGRHEPALLLRLVGAEATAEVPEAWVPVAPLREDAEAPVHEAVAATGLLQPPLLSEGERLADEARAARVAELSQLLRSFGDAAAYGDGSDDEGSASADSDAGEEGAAAASGPGLSRGDLESSAAHAPVGRPWEAWTSGLASSAALPAPAAGPAEYEEGDASWLVDETRDDVDALAMAARASAKRPGPRTRLGVSHAAPDAGPLGAAPGEAVAERERSRSAGIGSIGLSSVGAAASTGRQGGADPVASTVAAIARTIQRAVEAEAELRGVGPDDLDEATSRAVRRRAARKAYSVMISSRVREVRHGGDAGGSTDPWASVMTTGRLGASAGRPPVAADDAASIGSGDDWSVFTRSVDGDAGGVADEDAKGGPVEALSPPEAGLRERRGVALPFLDLEHTSSVDSSATPEEAGAGAADGGSDSSPEAESSSDDDWTADEDDEDRALLEAASAMERGDAVDDAMREALTVDSELLGLLRQAAQARLRGQDAELEDLLAQAEEERGRSVGGGSSVTGASEDGAASEGGASSAELLGEPSGAESLPGSGAAPGLDTRGEVGAAGAAPGKEDGAVTRARLAQEEADAFVEEAMAAAARPGTGVGDRVPFPAAGMGDGAILVPEAAQRRLREAYAASAGRSRAKPAPVVLDLTKGSSRRKRRGLAEASSTAGRRTAPRRAPPQPGTTAAKSDAARRG